MKLTLPQQDIYFEQLLHPGDPIYNIGAKLEVKGKIIYEILNEAYVALIDQHDSYRSTVVKKGDLVEIEILPEHNSELEYHDFSTEEDPVAYANNYMQQAFVKPYDLLSGELLHTFALIKVDEDFHYIFTMYHHIITDGWGTSLMFQRWVKNYNELIESGKIESEYPFSYKDFIIDDSEYELSTDFIEDKEYWSQQFQKLPEPLFEKFDKRQTSNKSKRKELYIKRDVYCHLEALAKEHRSTTFHVIVSILFMYFGRKHQNNDFAIGIPVLNRGKSIFKKTVGLFMGVSALRTSIDFENTFEELMAQVKQQLRQNYRHQRFPMGKLIKELGLFHNKEGLFNITLSYEKQNYSDHFADTKTVVLPLSHEAERVALALYIREFDEKEDVKIDFDYNLNYFTEESISQVVTHFETLVKEVCLNPSNKLEDFRYMTPAEEHRVLESFNDTSFSYPETTTFLSYFKNSAKVQSEKVAVKDGIKAYTFKELDVRSDKVARYLVENFGPENTSPVGVLMDRSADMIAILLGILKAGRSYIPLDPSFPVDRLAYIISHSEVECVVGEGSLREILEEGVSYLHKDLLLSDDLESSSVDLKEVNSKATAYIIYTSGSTGKPKGVAVGHKSLLNFLLSMQVNPGIHSSDVLFSVTTASFDISILEFFVPLLSGATLVIARKDVLDSPKAIINEFNRVQPTVIQATPSFYQMLFNAGWEGGRSLKVLCGGDLLSESLALKLLNSSKSVYNMYGPTETTIWSSCKKIVTPADAKNIGSPIHNTQLYVLDENLSPLPPLSTGAIYIGGDGLSQGYYKNAELTNSQFVKSPFKKGKKIYKTGDLGKWNQHGEIEFLGRIDHQVKVRGYRIETGEIEAKLNELSSVRDSVVVAKRNLDQGAFLVAYVIGNTENLNSELIISELKKSLPDYMIPYTIINVEAFPLTPNNKVDRKFLSNLDILMSENELEAKTPVTPLEIEISKIYQEVLELTEPVSTNVNFFSLGGHSLSAVKLIRLVEKQLNYQINLRDIFEYPTIESLSSYIQLEAVHNSGFIPKVEEEEFYPITSSQYAIWLASQRKQKSISYNMFTSYEINGELDTAILQQAFLQIIQKYEVLRTNFVEVKGKVYQKIQSQEECSFEINELVVESDEVDRTISRFVHQEFNLATDQLLRVAIVKTKSNDAYLVFATHHTIMDGWSLEVLITELASQYSALISSEIFEEDKMALQFKDYSAWLSVREIENHENNLKFWETTMKEYEWKPLFKYDHEDSDGELTGASHRASFNSDTIMTLKKLISARGSSLHSFLVAAFNSLVFLMKDEADVCVGTMNSGRNFADAVNQIGMFAKMLPLRSRISSKDSFVDILDRVHKNLLNVDVHQDIPEHLRSTFRLDALLVLQNQSFSFNSIKIIDQLELNLRQVDSNHCRLPLLLEFFENRGTLDVALTYDRNKYEAETIELIILKYEKLLEQIALNPKARISEIDIDLEVEKEEIVDISFNF